MRRVFPVLVILLGSLLAGCLADDDSPRNTKDTDPLVRPLLPDPLDSYLHNLSERVDTLTTITEQFRTPVTELIELDTWIIRPDVEGPVPIVLEVTPYYGGGEPSRLGRLGDELISRGYAVGVSSVRGTGNSGGCFTQGGPEEAVDTARVIEHVASQPWSNGNVGLIGVSYPGTTPQDVWVEAPQSLKTIVPISGISDLYKYNFVNGVPINIQGFGFNTYYWLLVGLSPAGLGGGSQIIDPVHVATAGAGEACTDQVEVQEGGVSSTVDGNKDAYWQVRDFHAELRSTWDRNPDRASVFYIHGLQDWNVKPHHMEDWLEAIQETDVPFKIWLGQWGHAWPQSSNPANVCELGDPCRADWWNRTLVAWFDQFLKEKDTGILDAPAVQVQDDDGVWRHEHDWPPRDVSWLRLFPDADGTLGEQAGSGVVSYHDRRGGLRDLPLDPVGSQVVFVSEPVPANMTLSGLPVFHGNVTASGDRASLVFSLRERMADGEERSINFAALSLNHAESLAAGKSSIANLRQEVHLRFFPQDDVIHEGSRIVLVASGNTVGRPGPNLQPVSDGSTITLDLEGAWLHLPVDVERVVEDPQPFVVPVS